MIRFLVIFTLFERILHDFCKKKLLIAIFIRAEKSTQFTGFEPFIPSANSLIAFLLDFNKIYIIDNEK